METYLIAGLGNPGPKYKDTRHNAGYLALDRLAQSIGARVDSKRFNSLTGDALVDGRKFILMKPETYMNLSGDALSAAARYLELDARHIIVMSDDVDLPVGRIRVRDKGSAGGHNGLKDIIGKLSSEEFIRIRMGIGPKRPEMELKDFVLGHFDKDEKTVMSKVFDMAADAALCAAAYGAKEAMSRFNGTGLNV